MKILLSLQKKANLIETWSFKFFLAGFSVLNLD